VPRPVNTPFQADAVRANHTVDSFGKDHYGWLLYEKGSDNAWSGQMYCGQDIGENHPTYDEWNCFTLEFIVPENIESGTIFFWTEPQYPVKHNDVYLDDAHLIVLDQPYTTPTPTQTPSPTPTVESSSIVHPTTGLNLRTGPGITYPILAVLRPEDSCIIFSTLYNNSDKILWAEVHCTRENGSEVEGWVSRDYLAIFPPNYRESPYHSIYLSNLHPLELLWKQQ
jgi:hypothetical protein